MHANKLLKLHHELFYPAILGAIIYDFARKIGDGWTTGFDCLWFWSILWFIAYFSAAFLSLTVAEEDERAANQIVGDVRYKFGIIAFIANFFEIVLILYISTLITLTQFGPLHYRDVYFFWIVIPLTAFISNAYSERPVRKILSLAAAACGVFGLVIARDSHDLYVALLVIMTILLFIYFLQVFTEKPKFSRAVFGCFADASVDTNCGFTLFVVALIAASGVINYIIYHDARVFGAIFVSAFFVYYYRCIWRR